MNDVVDVVGGLAMEGRSDGGQFHTQGRCSKAFVSTATTAVLAFRTWPPFYGSCSHQSSKDVYSRPGTGSTTVQKGLSRILHTVIDTV